MVPESQGHGPFPAEDTPARLLYPRAMDWNWIKLGAGATFVTLGVLFLLAKAEPAVPPGIAP